MRFYRVMKRAADILFAVLIGAVFLPFGLVIALLIRLESPGPAIFRQLRAGKDGKLFKICKFRTMRLETERDGQALGDMQRMTRIGSVLRKLSVDELPQLLNILKGEMSFVGPRPLLPEYLVRYTPFQMRRHEATPGITGWSQVNGRNAISWEEKFRLDVWYVDHRSLWLDVKIVAMTAVMVVKRKGVNSSSGNTMPIFEGTKEHEDG